MREPAPAFPQEAKGEREQAQADASDSAETQSGGQITPSL
jgi:hypothetical protein